MRVGLISVLLGSCLVGVCHASECTDKYEAARKACLAAIDVAAQRETTRIVDSANRARQSCLESFSEKSGAELLGNNLFVDQLLRQVLYGQVKPDAARQAITQIVADRRKLCS